MKLALGAGSHSSCRKRIPTMTAWRPLCNHPTDGTPLSRSLVVLHVTTSKLITRIKSELLALVAVAGYVCQSPFSSSSGQRRRCGKSGQLNHRHANDSFLRDRDGQHQYEFLPFIPLKPPLWSDHTPYPPILSPSPQSHQSNTSQSPQTQDHSRSISDLDKDIYAIPVHSISPTNYQN